MEFYMVLILISISICYLDSKFSSKDNIVPINKEYVADLEEPALTNGYNKAIDDL